MTADISDVPLLLTDYSCQGLPAQTIFPRSLCTPSSNLILEEKSLGVKESFEESILTVDQVLCSYWRLTEKFWFFYSDLYILFLLHIHGACARYTDTKPTFFNQSATIQRKQKEDDLSID